VLGEPGRTKLCSEATIKNGVGPDEKVYVAFGRYRKVLTGNARVSSTMAHAFAPVGAVPLLLEIEYGRSSWGRDRKTG